MMYFNPVLLNEIGVFGLYIVFGYLVGGIIESYETKTPVSKISSVIGIVPSGTCESSVNDPAEWYQ
jgi:hypothetical protein